MKGRQVLLTGGTGGLGLGVTPVVLAQGANLTITYRNLKEVERLKEVLRRRILPELTFFPLIWKKNLLLIISSPASVG